LGTFFGETTTRRLARVAPATLLAGATGLTLAALMSAPGFADTGTAVVIGGIAVNFTSSLLEQLVMLPLEAEEEREHLIDQGLQQRDPGVTNLVAATLTAAGPEIAQALPETGHAQIITGMETAMQQAGGPLAAIAPQYTAALRNPQTDWDALQAALRTTITRVSQTMEASEEGVISGSEQDAQQASGPVEQEMRATKKGRIENSRQSVTGGKNEPPTA
jgi:hypothetical protein